MATTIYDARTPTNRGYKIQRVQSHCLRNENGVERKAPNQRKPNQHAARLAHGIKPGSFAAAEHHDLASRRCGGSSRKNAGQVFRIGSLSSQREEQNRRRQTNHVSTNYAIVCIAAVSKGKDITQNKQLFRAFKCR